MTQEFINRLFAEMMGKHYHIPVVYPDGKVSIYKCSIPRCDFYKHQSLDPLSYTQFYASLNGEITKEVRDWFAKEMPEEWESYLQGIAISPAPQRNNDTFFTETYDRQSSITNLAQYIVDNYKEMPLSAEAVKIIEETKEGKE